MKLVNEECRMNHETFPSVLDVMITDIQIMDINFKEFDDYSHTDFKGDAFESILNASDHQKFCRDVSVVLFGRCQNGASVCIKVTDFKPWLFFKTDKEEEIKIRKAVENITKNVSFEKVQAAFFVGFERDENDVSKMKAHNFVKAIFPNISRLHL